MLENLQSSLSLGNDSVNSLLVGLNTMSPEMKQRWLVDNQANASTESLLHCSPPNTDEDVAIYDALEQPRARTRLSPKTPISRIGNFSGTSGSPSSSGGSKWMLNPRAREYKPKRFSHSAQELRTGITNLSSIEICRLPGGGSGELIRQPSSRIYPSLVSSPISIPNLYSVSPVPSPTNNFYHSSLKNSPKALSPVAPPQPPFLYRPTPETSPHKPTTTAIAKSKSPVTLNLPSEPVISEPSLDESTSDANVDLPTAAVTIQPPLFSDWFPLDDGIECTLPPGLTLNETRFSTQLSADSTHNGTPDSTSPSAGLTQNETQSTLPYDSTQNERPDSILASNATDQSQTFSREELYEYMNRVLYDLLPRKRLPVFENITLSESNY